MSAKKKISQYVPVLKDQGMDYLSAAPKAGICSFPLLLTQVGSSPYTVTFASLGLPDMASASYVVMVHSETSSAKIDESTKAATGFDLIGGSNADVINVFISGQLKGQAA